METLYFTNENVSLYYDPTRKMGRAVWIGFMSGELFRSNINAAMELIENKKPILWLADNRKMRAIRQKDQEWLAAEVLPRLALSSIKRLATLISEDIFNQMAVEHLLTHNSYAVGYENQFFKEEQTALNWLRAYRPAS